MRIIVTGGGSGGHIFPILALLPILKKNAEVFYIGENNGIEERLAKENGVRFFGISATKLVRGKVKENLSIPQKLYKSIKEAEKILTKLSPDVVFSKGGYVALPVVFAAKRKGIPIVIHESDVTMGLTNKLCVPLSDKVLTSFEIKKDGKYITTSAPIRKEIIYSKKKRLFPDNKPTLLVLGGSLGAKELNDYVKNNIDRIKNVFNTVLISGENKGEEIKNSYYIEKPFVGSIGEYIASADVCISRGGAGTLFELAVKRLPSVIVPLTNSESRGEQNKNAEYFSTRGMFYLHRKDKDLLEEAINVYENRDKYILAMNDQQISDGKQKIAEEILSADQRH